MNNSLHRIKNNRRKQFITIILLLLAIFNSRDNRINVKKTMKLDYIANLFMRRGRFQKTLLKKKEKAVWLVIFDTTKN